MVHEIRKAKSVEQRFFMHSQEGVDPEFRAGGGTPPGGLGDIA